MALKFTINNVEKEYDVHPETPLLSFLRNTTKNFGAKYGCGHDMCGACTVYVGDNKVHSCQIKVSDVKEPITTIEGFVKEKPEHPLIYQWLEKEVPQCGFCQPGMLLSAAKLLDENASPSREDIKTYLDHNLCRCGTYPRVVDAVYEAAQMLKDGTKVAIEHISKPEEIDPGFQGYTDGFFRPTPWVEIAEDNTVTIFSPPAELGQGSLNTLARILAEEMDADWSKVRIEYSPLDDAEFGNPVYWAHGIMITVGSSTLPNYYPVMRKHGAQVRRILLDNVSEHWGVAADELSTQNGMVIHDQSDRKMSYGQIASFAKTPDVLPTIEDKDLKLPGDFNLIGKHIARRDMYSKTVGSAVFSMDVDFEGLLFARIIREPVKNAKVVILDDSKARELPSVVDVIELPDGHGVGVVAYDYESAWLGADYLDIKWSDAAGSLFDSEKEIAVQKKMAEDLTLTDFTLQSEGDLDQGFEKAEKTYQASYVSDFFYHAQLEPLNAVAWVKEDGLSVEIWVGTQAPTHLLRQVAKASGIAEEHITIHRTYLGGGFGRRAAMDQDWVVNTVLLSQKLKRPVKSVRSREDDIKYGRFKPISAHHLRAAVDANGDLTSFHHRLVSDEPIAQSDPWRYEKNNHFAITTHPALTIPYTIANRKAEIIKHKLPVWLSPMRGVTAIINRFASESFIDEIAIGKNADPLDYRLQMMDDQEAIAVLEKVAEISNWRERGDRYMGIAYIEVDGLHAATVAEIDYPKDDGIIKVKKLWMAIDAGLIVTPYNALSQVEGATIFALSNVLKERITIRNGEVEQQTMEDYPLLKISECPEIEVEFIETERAPTGLGDLAGMAVAPAVAAAFFQRTACRLYRYPFTPELVKKAMDKVTY